MIKKQVDKKNCCQRQRPVDRPTQWKRTREETENVGRGGCGIPVRGNRDPGGRGMVGCWQLQKLQPVHFFGFKKIRKLHRMLCDVHSTSSKLARWSFDEMLHFSFFWTVDWYHEEYVKKLTIGSIPGMLSTLTWWTTEKDVCPPIAKPDQRGTGSNDLCNQWHAAAATTIGLPSYNCQTLA